MARSALPRSQSWKTIPCSAPCCSFVSIDRSCGRSPSRAASVSSGVSAATIPSGSRRGARGCPRRCGGSPQPIPSAKFAHFGPTPANLSRTASSHGISPLCFATIVRAMPWSVRDFGAWKTHGATSASICSGVSAAIAVGVRAASPATRQLPLEPYNYLANSAACRGSHPACPRR